MIWNKKTRESLGSSRVFALHGINWNLELVRPAGIEPARLTAADFLTRYCSRSRIA